MASTNDFIKQSSDLAIPNSPTASIHELPNELLHEVFSYCVQKQAKNKTYADSLYGTISVTPQMAVRLNQVCRRWQTVAHGCTALWGDLTTVVHPDRLIGEGVAQFQRFLSDTFKKPYVTGIPSCWFIKLDRVGKAIEKEVGRIPDTCLPVSQPLKHIIHPLSSTLRHLKLVNAQLSDFVDLEDLAFPMLDNLELKFDEGIRFDSFESHSSTQQTIRAFKDAPLKKLAATRQIMDLLLGGDLPFTWTGLREFREDWTEETRASNTPSHIITKMLPKCPHIEKLHVCLCENDAQDPSQRGSTVELPKLRHLEIHVFHKQDASVEVPEFNLWHSFSFPSLQSLHYGAVDATGIRHPTGTPFPAEIVNKLRTFKVGAVGEDWELGVDASRRALEIMPNFERLVLSAHAWAHNLKMWPGPDDDLAKVSLVSFLRCPEDEARVILPRLRHLELMYESPESDGIVDARLYDALSTFLEYIYAGQGPSSTGNHDLKYLSSPCSHRAPLETVTLRSRPGNSDNDRDFVSRLEDLCAKYKVQLILE